MKQTFHLVHDEARRRAWAAIGKAPQGHVVTIAEPNRSSEQNAAQWPILHAYATQKQMCINGVMEWASEEDWKDVLTGAHKEELARVANYRGRMVILGKKTSKFGKGEFSLWLDWLNAAAIEDGIELDEVTA